MPKDTASILIVDDRPDKVLALEAVLENLGQTIIRAYSGREALRHVLDREFAVILLDVNMPGMDGFETASLIRQRKSSEQVPIIFITAFDDEMHASRGYSLGAVDYILAPVLPDVLRTKVSVFVELFLKTEQLKKQAEWLRQRAAQMHKLTAASLAINSAVSIEQMLSIVTDTARQITAAHQAKASVDLPSGLHRSVEAVSMASGYATPDEYPFVRQTEVWQSVTKSNRPARLTRLELEAACGTPLGAHAQGWLAVPLTGREGRNMGALELATRDERGFTSDDESLLVQLAQMASIAVENAIFAEEREANRVKDEFLATLSHELRTPLNAILGWTQLLRSEITPNGGVTEESLEEVAHGLDVIERNARSQTKLIEDLLDVSRIATGKMRLNTRPTSLGPLVQAAADAIRPTLDSKRITAEWSFESPDVTVNGDADRLQQVFWNLLSNAVKFTPERGRITVRLHREGKWVNLVVTDSGAGIDPKFLPYVFDRFRQADSTSTRSHGGLGIGLTIVRHIVETHGGMVAADSAGEGRGATFTIKLPIWTCPDIQANPGNHDDCAAPGDAAYQRTNGKSFDLSGLRVLVVDDDPDAREMFSALLERAGAIVSCAGSADVALSMIQGEAPDILISDIAMPQKDGYDLIREVRLSLTEVALPAIAVTAYAREEDRRRAMTSGFQAHVAKPIEPDHLLNAVARLANQPARAVQTRFAADTN